MEAKRKKEIDRFFELYKEVTENSQPDPGFTERVISSLKNTPSERIPEREKRRGFWFFIPSAAAVAAVLLFFYVHSRVTTKKAMDYSFLLSPEVVVEEAIQTGSSVHPFVGYDVLESF